MTTRQRPQPSQPSVVQPRDRVAFAFSRVTSALKEAMAGEMIRTGS